MAQSVDTVMCRLRSYRGRRVSVVNRSDVRFEGWLQDVVPELQIISVDKVRVRFSGTESRRPEKPVAARSEMCSLSKIQLWDAKEIFVHLEHEPEICTNSETNDAELPILWMAIPLGNKEAGVTLPVPPPTANDIEARLDTPITMAVKLLSEALQQKAKPRISFICRLAKLHYQGTLEGLDPDKCVVFLSDVHVLDTEGRPGEKKGATERYSSVTLELDQMENLRIHVAMCENVLGDNVVVEQSSPGMIELEAGHQFQAALLQNNTEAARETRNAFMSADSEPAQNDTRQEDMARLSSSQPVEMSRQDTVDSLLNESEPSLVVCKSHRNSRAHTKGSSSEEPVYAGGVAAGVTREPSLSTADTGNRYAGLFRSSSVSLANQSSKKVYNTRKRMASAAPENLLPETAKKGKNSSVANDGPSVGSSKAGSARKPRTRNPTEISKVVRPAAEPNRAGLSNSEEMVQIETARTQIFEEWRKRIYDIESVIQERIITAYDFGNTDQRRFQPGELALALCPGDAVFYEANIVQYQRNLPVPRISDVDNPTVWTCTVHYPGWSKDEDEEHMEIELLSCGLDSANDAAGMLLAHEWNTWVRMKLGKKKLGRSSWNLSDEDYAQLEHYWQIHDGMDVSFSEYSGRRQAEAVLASLALKR